ncbi:hypothetical protein [Bordetella genomosp. 4]|uniref:Phage replication protein n=1 Tax=Bordetella genomosp. 4 TaxID=463044 RepID=A0A261U471_9BORD|nr:hypothetical protein [Bordetella genomosp. 4]OZI56756.1 hypothetical protein CAL20_15260 [Bordetella genomosp. 4]
MARIRTIKPDFWTDEKLTECSLSARLMFIGMLNFADDNGNLAASAKKLKMQIFPADNIDCQPLLDELIAHGVVIEYSVNGDKFLNIKGFKKHQIINRPSKSAIPEPAFNEDSVNTHGVVTDGKEGNGIGKEEPPPNPPPGGEEPVEPSANKPKRERKARCTLKTFIDQCRTAGETAISGYKPLLEYVDGTGLPMDFVQLAWEVFKSEHLAGGANDRRLQADWRRHFLNYVTKGYYRLWYANAEGHFSLTTVGIQAKKIHSKEAA